MTLDNLDKNSVAPVLDRMRTAQMITGEKARPVWTLFGQSLALGLQSLVGTMGLPPKMLDRLPRALADFPEWRLVVDAVDRHGQPLTDAEKSVLFQLLNFGLPHEQD